MMDQAEAYAQERLSTQKKLYAMELSRNEAEIHVERLYETLSRDFTDTRAFDQKKSFGLYNKPATPLTNI